MTESPVDPYTLVMGKRPIPGLPCPIISLLSGQVAAGHILYATA